VNIVILQVGWMTKLVLVPLYRGGSGTSRDKLDKSGQVGQVRDKSDKFGTGWTGLCLGTSHAPISN
jgi:hypothetical protein